MLGRRGLFGCSAIVLLTAAATAPVPSGRWGVSHDDYPAEALRQRLQGATRFEIAVDDAGKPTACTIIKSSGHDVLDQRACAVLLRDARFKPAQDDAAHPIPGVWRHLVVWTSSTSPRSKQPAFGGYGVMVTFDGEGSVSTCKVVQLSAISKVSEQQAGSCGQIGTAAVFAELLDRPTQGLSQATFRVRSESSWAGAPLRSGEPFQRVLAHVEIDRLEDGTISWCDVKVAPLTPRVAFDGGDPCGPKAFGVTHAGGGGFPEQIIFDVVAAL